jgi:hypothetical protein
MNRKDIHLYGCWLSRFGPVALWYCRLRMACIWGFYIPYDGMTMIKSYCWYYFFIGIRQHPLTLSRGLLSLLISTRNISFDIHREISTIYMTSTYIWPFQVIATSILVGHLIDIRRELVPTTWPFHVIDTSILVGHLIDIRRELAPYIWPFHVIDKSILVGHLIDIRRELAPTTWPFHVIDKSILVGHLIDIRRELAPTTDLFQVIDTSILVEHLIDIRRESSTLHMTFPRHWYIHFGGISHRHSSWV